MEPWDKIPRRECGPRTYEYIRMSWMWLDHEYRTRLYLVSFCGIMFYLGIDISKRSHEACLIDSTGKSVGKR